jgi:hypothetical protein
VIVQHAFDNWDVVHARKLPGFVRLWNQAGRRPRLALAAPEAYFRHVEVRYGDDLPVYRGEWGEQWGRHRAGCPVWTWRLREAMKTAGPTAPTSTRAALASAMDHNLGLGAGWPGMFTKAQTIQHARESAELFARAVRLALGDRAVRSLPPMAGLSPSDSLPVVWKEMVPGDPPARLRAGKLLFEPFIPDDAPVFGAPLAWGADATRLRVQTRVDRRRVPLSDSMLVAVVLEIPLRAPASQLRIADAGSASALAGYYLRDEPPRAVVAPEGVRILGLARPLRVRSSIAFVYTLAPDRRDPGLTWLQCLVVKQGELCELKGGRSEVLPLEQLYPGEPVELDVAVELEISS